MICDRHTSLVQALVIGLLPSFVPAMGGGATKAGVDV